MWQDNAWKSAFWKPCQSHIDRIWGRPHIQVTHAKDFSQLVRNSSLEWMEWYIPHIFSRCVWSLWACWLTATCSLEASCEENMERACSLPGLRHHASTVAVSLAATASGDGIWNHHLQESAQLQWKTSQRDLIQFMRHCIHHKYYTIPCIQLILFHIGEI